jgi:RNA polymerase sigma-70 factor (sigma-E family)
VTSADGFTEFATAAAPRLRRTAFLLSGDWHTAEDLVQTTLTKMFVSWRRVSQMDALLPYATRALVNTYLAGRRRRRAAELLLSKFPERAVEPQEPELKIVVLDALATLPTRARAVVVLRYWEDLSIEQVADLLGCSAGNVKSQSARGLDKLRAVLGDEAAGYGPLAHRPPGEPGETRGARHG